jgi:hypothetical protein
MNTKTNDGGPAFPAVTMHDALRGMPGMTLRDCFAAAALQGMLSDPNNCTTLPETAMYAYRSADAMLIERAKTKEAQP